MHAMRIQSPQHEVMSDPVINELGLNLGDLVPFALDDEALRLGERFSEAEIHGPPSAWEGLDA